MTKSQLMPIAAWARSTWVDSGVWLPSMPQWKLPITSWQPLVAQLLHAGFHLALGIGVGAQVANAEQAHLDAVDVIMWPCGRTPKFVMPAARSASIVSV